MARKKKKSKKRRKGRAPTKPSEGGMTIPPKDNIGRCAVCGRVTDIALIEVSRRMFPDQGIVTKRAYSCRKHASELTDKIVKSLSWATKWSDPEDIEWIETEIDEEEIEEEADESEDGITFPDETGESGSDGEPEEDRESEECSTEQIS